MSQRKQVSWSHYMKNLKPSQFSWDKIYYYIRIEVFALLIIGLYVGIV